MTDFHGLAFMILIMQASVETLQPNPPEDGEQDCADLPFAANQMFGFADGEGRPVACGGFGNPVSLARTL